MTLIVSWKEAEESHESVSLAIDVNPRRSLV